MRSSLIENGRLSPTARTLWEVESACARVSVEASSNLYTDVMRKTEAAVARADARRNDESLTEHRAYIKEAFLKCIGGLPEARGKEARIMSVLDCGGFSVEKILLEPQEGAFISANVYAPNDGREKMPAVLITVGHTDLGKADIEYQRLAQYMARAGFVALVFDPLGEGERTEHYEPEIDLQPIQGCSGEHDLLDWKCKLMGLSLARYFVRDGICALDYLSSREDVDATKIALTGHSGGGTQACMLIAACGERFAATAPCSYISDITAMLECGVDPDNEMMWPGGTLAGLDYIDMLYGALARPMLFITAAHDFFPREGTLRTFEKAREAVAREGGALPEMYTAESKHAYTDGMARACAEFFSKHLTGREADFSDFEFTPIEARELNSTDEGCLLKAFPDMRTVHMCLTDELSECERVRKGVGRADILSWLRGNTGFDAARSPASPIVESEGVCGRYVYKVMKWRPRKGYWNTGVLLRDMRAGDKPLPTIVAAWKNGLARITEHSNYIHKTVSGGRQLFITDTVASGTLMPNAVARSNMHIGWGTMYKLNAYLIQLGSSLCMLRVSDLCEAVSMVARMECVDGAGIYAEGEFSRYAYMAALLTGAPVKADGNFQSYTEIVSEKYHDQTHTPDWAVAGVLRVFDIGDIKRILGDDGLLLG